MTTETAPTYVAGGACPIERGNVQAAAEYIVTHGLDTAEKVVEDAGNPQSLLYAYFDWDDAAAARQFRLAQARIILNSLRIEVYTVAGGTRAVPLFYNVREDTDDSNGRDAAEDESKERPISPGPGRTPGRYVVVEVVQETPSYLEQQLHEAESRMQSWTNRFASLASDNSDARARLLAALDKAREEIE